MGFQIDRYRLRRVKKSLKKYSKVEKDKLNMANVKPRYVEIHDINFPKEYTASGIVILPNGEGNGFRLDSYSEKLIGLVTEEQFIKTIYEANKICYKTINEDQAKQAKDPFLKHKQALISLIPLQIISIILYILRIYIKELYNKNILIIIATIIQSFIVLTVGFIFVKAVSKNFVPVQLEEIIQEKLENYFKQVEKTSPYKENYITFKVPYRYFYIEIHIDFNKNGKQSYYIQKLNEQKDKKNKQIQQQQLQSKSSLSQQGIQSSNQNFLNSGNILDLNQKLQSQEGYQNFETGQRLLTEN